MKTMTMMLVASALLATGAAAAPTPADPYATQTAADLGRVCADPAGASLTQPERERLLVCGAYIRGYLGHYSATRPLTQETDFCLPDAGISAEQLRRLYIAVLAKQPQIRDDPAATDLASILQAAYPCKKTDKP